MKDHKTNPDPDRVRELLDLAAPRDTGATGRADAVTRRARRSRTRNRVAGGVALAGIAAAVVITPSFLKTSPTTNEANDGRTATSSLAPADQGAAALENPCPDQDGLYDGGSGKSVIKGDASTIRLCWIGLSGMYVEPWSPPADALLDPAGFFAALRDAEPADPSRCMATTPLPDPLYFQLTYPDGTTSRAESNGYCSDISVDGTAYTIDDVMTAFTTALSTQRASLDAPADVPATTVGCDIPADARPYTRGPKPDENTTFSALVVCAGDEGATADAGALSQLNVEWASAVGGPSSPSCPPDVAGADTSRGFAVTSWGDSMKVSFGDCSTISIGGVGVIVSPELLDALAG